MSRVVIEYCAQCRWLLRAGWVAQELLTTFVDELEEVALRPGSGGVFRVTVDGQLVTDRRADDGFIDMAELKTRLRDLIAPERALGHSDRRSSD